MVAGVLAGRIAGLGLLMPAVLLLGLLGLLVPETARAAGPGRIFALVVGIDRYAHYPDLEGAVADAQDIATALKRHGAQVTMLLDDKARFERIRQAWFDLLGRAKRGDLLVFTYSGHGGQEPEAVPGSEADGMDETFILSGFDPRAGKGSRERLVDNEINAWFKAARSKGVRIIFVADSCHSGTMTRSVDPRVHTPAKAIPPYGLPATAPLSSEVLSGAKIKVDDLPHVTFFAATQEGRKVPEIDIDDRKRGALSYAFARALERQGVDRNTDGFISRFELEAYIRPLVRQLSEARQTPDIQPRSSNKHEPLFKSGSGAAEVDTAAVTPPVLRLRIMAPNDDLQKELARSLQGIRMTNQKDGADLVWDAEQQTVVTALGDVAAYHIDQYALQGVIDKWQALKALKQMARENPLNMTLEPDDSRHPDGRIITFTTDPVRYSHVTVINLAPDGTVKFLYPLPTDPKRWRVGKPYRLRLRAMAPFGADHLIVIASKRSLSALYAQLRRVPAAQLPRLLRQALTAMRHEIAVQGLYTFAGAKTQGGRP